MTISDDNMVKLQKLIMGQADLNQIREINRMTNEAWKRLNRQANAQMAQSLREGSRVQFGDNVRPQYLQGKLGVVTEFRSTRVLVKLDCGPIGKFRSGSVVSSPASLKLSDAPSRTERQVNASNLQELFDEMGK